MRFLGTEIRWTKAVIPQIAGFMICLGSTPFSTHDRFDLLENQAIYTAMVAVGMLLVLSPLFVLAVLSHWEQQ